MVKMSFSFTKRGAMRFISHLDLMRLFMRALRRAQIPLKMTQGFSPHPKLSIRRALKLGVESDQEDASIVLAEGLEPVEFRKRLNEQLPEGIEVKDAQRDIY
jgi:radical SAM-linked protein